MDLRQLRYFVTVAEERNFTRAAGRLHIAQPPLSRQIQVLESDLDTMLIDRDARPLRLTETGRLLYEQARQLLRRVDEMRTMIERASASDRRRFVIGYVASTIYARLPALIRTFRQQAPGIELRLVEVGSLDQIGALKEGRIDVGFGRIRFEDPALRRTVLREERLVAAVPATHPLARWPGPLPLIQLCEEPMILYPSTPRPSYADQVLSILHDNHLEPRIAHEVRELQIAVGLVAAEEGVCLVPESVRQSRTEDVRYLDLVETATSPIIMSQRVGDVSPEISVMSAVIASTYREWGYVVPLAIEEMAAA